MTAFVTIVSPILAAAFGLLFVFCGELDTAMACLLFAPAGVMIAPYLDGAE
jgi:hypothetical protein